MIPIEQDEPPESAFHRRRAQFEESAYEKLKRLTGDSPDFMEEVEADMYDIGNSSLIGEPAPFTQKELEESYLTWGTSRDLAKRLADLVFEAGIEYKAFRRQQILELRLQKLKRLGADFGDEEIKEEELHVPPVRQTAKKKVVKKKAGKRKRAAKKKTPQKKRDLPKGIWKCPKCLKKMLIASRQAHEKRLHQKGKAKKPKKPKKPKKCDQCSAVSSSTGKRCKNRAACDVGCKTRCRLHASQEAWRERCD